MWMRNQPPSFPPLPGNFNSLLILAKWWLLDVASLSFYEKLEFPHLSFLDSFEVI